jgi:hypothetical protein
VCTARPDHAETFLNVHAEGDIFPNRELRKHLRHLEGAHNAVAPPGIRCAARKVDAANRMLPVSAVATDDVEQR